MSERQSLQNAPRQRHTGARCVHCRQMKVKCDVNERYPTPCTRCNKSGRRCHIDPLFKRVSKRGRLESIEREVRELRESLKAPQQQSEHISPPTAESIGSPSAVEFDGLTPQDPLPSLLSLCERLKDPSNGMLRTIANVELTSSMTADLVEIYYSTYHLKFALLTDPATCIQAYETCPLLFWMVMAIAAKRSDQYSYIYPRLAEPIKALATAHTSPLNRNILFVQGLLLLSLWSMPFHAVVEDPSWLYCGIATHMAMLLGLHQPQYAAVVLSAGESDKGPLYIRERTWLGCFIINQELSTKHGIPATLAPDHTILRALTSSSGVLTQNDPFESQLQIAHISARTNKLLGQHDAVPTGLFSSPLPLIHMIDSELNLLHTRYSETWASATEISFLYTRLNLYSYGLARSRQPPNSAPDADGEAQLVVLGSRAAMRLLSLATEAPDEVVYGTHYTHGCIIFAALFLLRLTKTSAMNLIDLVAARNTISDTWKLLKDLSQDHEDHFARVSEIIEYMSDADVVWSEGGEAGSSNNAQSWMGKNFVVDVVVRARARFAKPGYHSVAAHIRSHNGADGAAAPGNELGMALDLAANMGGGADWMADMGFVNFGWADRGMVMGVPEFGNEFGGYGFP